jgi:hypothetical protein
MVSSCFQAGLFLDLFFDPEYVGDYSFGSLVELNRLHNIISQETEIFIAIAVITSYHTRGNTVISWNLDSMYFPLESKVK